MPTTVPERRRSDATLMVPSPRYVPGSTTRSSSDTHAMPSGIPSAPRTHDEVIVPSAVATVSSVLDEVRKPPAERLELAGKVAEGGMGTIDVAVDRALDRKLAIKTLHGHLRSDESAVRMFLREARLTGLLDHPHIVPVYDIGERDDEKLYFAMKLVEGQTLAELIRSLPKGPFDTTTLYAMLDVVTKVCDALAFAHSRGVIHCDIKPANVMVGEYGQVYLMDWGIARLMAAEPSPGSAMQPDAKARARTPSATDNSVIGTPGYMAPEQARGDRGKLDARSDVFLLGALLYEVLTRQAPYANADRNERLAQAAACVFPSPRKVVGEAAVPSELERIVLRAMAQRPEDRYPSASALREDIARFMRGGAEFPRRSFPAGAVIIDEGDAGDAAYIVVDGRCEVRKEMPSTTRGSASGATTTTVLKTLGPGAVFGEMAILTDGPRTASVVAIEDTTVLVVTAAVLEQEMAALKPWMASLLKSLATRFRDIDEQNRATFASSPSPARVANQILMHVATWGEALSCGSRQARWSELSAEVEAQMGMPPVAIFSVLQRYGMELDTDADTLTIAKPAELASRLRAELGT